MTLEQKPICGASGDPTPLRCRLVEPLLELACVYFSSCVNNTKNNTRQKLTYSGKTEFGFREARSISAKSEVKPLGPGIHTNKNQNRTVALRHTVGTRRKWKPTMRQYNAGDFLITLSEKNTTEIPSVVDPVYQLYTTWRGRTSS